MATLTRAVNGARLCTHRYARKRGVQITALVLVAALLVIRGAVTPPQWIPVSSATAYDSTEPFFDTRALPSTTKIVHAPQAVALPDGRLAVFWFGGTKEGRTDVQIYRQILQDGEPIEAPKAILSPAALGDRLGIYVKNLGNPVPYYHQGELHLFVVSVALGGWATAQFSHLISSDLGDTWHTARQPITSPFFNQSTLVRTSPVPTRDGFLLPAYFEQGRINPMWLRFDEHGRFKGSQTLNIPGLQPEMLATDPDTLHVLARQVRNGKLVHITTDAHGNLRQPANAQPPNNPNSAVSAVMLSPEHWIMVHNPGNDRSVLAISQTTDAGVNWETLRTLEREAGERFSYPHLLIGPDGLFHLLYTHKRQHIQYVRFNLAGLTP